MTTAERPPTIAVRPRPVLTGPVRTDSDQANTDQADPDRTDSYRAAPGVTEKEHWNHHAPRH